MPRFLALDYGRRRCGLAHSDPGGVIATPLDTVDTPELWNYLRQYPFWENLDGMVVGLPLQVNSEPSENAARTLAFCAKLHKHRPTLPLYLLDERFTSSLAHQSLLESGASKATRRRKDLVDRIAAVLLLQDFLEMHNNDRLHHLTRFENQTNP
ncbi:MAG: Holliday junction resolvase RuvX [Bacteroidota bacterium]